MIGIDGGSSRIDRSRRSSGCLPIDRIIGEAETSQPCVRHEVFLGTYTSCYNRRHKEFGHLFSGESHGDFFGGANQPIGTDRGAFELVRDAKITQYCVQNHLSTRERLA
jgi:hypothetical protein